MRDLQQRIEDLGRIQEYGFRVLLAVPISFNIYMYVIFGRSE